MNKNAAIILLTAIILVPAATAAVIGGVQDTLTALFNASDIDLAYIKAGIWLVLFFLVFKSAERIFPFNRGAALIISLVVSMLGARYMPDEYLEYVGGWYAVILGIILVMVPFFAGSIIGDMLRWGKRGKTFLIILFYASLGYFLFKMPEDLPFKTEALSIFGVVLDWARENTIIALIIIGVICAYFLWRGKDSGSPAPMGMPGSGGPSFWGGLRTGAQGAGNWAQAGGRGFLGWMARKRAAAKMRWAIQEAHRRKPANIPSQMPQAQAVDPKLIERQRAMLKAGWEKKAQMLRDKLIHDPAYQGKLIAKAGGQNYPAYIKDRERLQRALKKLGRDKV
ncbi:hypothetical protein FJZ53_05705 [Candidatus Woesearchaeota archaeon]|nr:hypothetical protein [Candidatus Woesearchaeota archaeon]